MPFVENVRLTELFDELVPPSGAAQSLAGELVRAVSKIGYRFYNDGDIIGIGYGNETCNVPARFLIYNLPKQGSEIVSCMWGNNDDTSYENLLNQLEQFIVGYIDSTPATKTLPLLDDVGMYSDRYKDDDDYNYDDEDIYSDYEDTYDDEEDM